MKDDCQYLLEVLEGAVKVCRKAETSCAYVGDTTIKLYGEYQGTYRQCMKAFLLLSIASGNIPLAVVLLKKMLFLQNLEVN